AIQYLKIAPAPVVIGYDLNKEIYKQMKHGLISAAICHEPFNQGYFSVKVLYRFLRSGIRPSSSLIYNKLEVVMPANAKYYLDESLQTELFQK
ncbi:MAG: hypothetical protein SO005_13685, partial [Candidatus Choladocola sp.]|nr:hypothetical protein [Candidatus Choladocola sp.]